MKQTGLVMRGYRVNDYILILNPSTELSNPIGTIPDEFIKEYHVPPRRVNRIYSFAVLPNLR